jgi:hypothetical protein
MAIFGILLHEAKPRCAMASKKSAKITNPGAGVVKSPKPRTLAPKRKEIPVVIERVRKRMKRHKPPQSWHDEDHTGLY